MSQPSSLHTAVRVLQPSLLSTGVMLGLAGVTVATLLTPSVYVGSEFARYFESLQTYDSAIYQNYLLLLDAINRSKFAADSSVFVVWMVIGLMAYAIAVSGGKLIASLIRFVRDVEYFKKDREHLAREATLHLLIRAVAAGALYAFYLLWVPFVLSYVFVFAHKALTGSVFAGVWYALLIGLIVGVSVHVLVVLMRIMLLRVRVFFSKYDDVTK